jgi:hypothetical protein
MKRSLPLALLLGLAAGASIATAQSANTSIIDRAQQPAPPPAAPTQAETSKALGQESEDLGVQRIAQPRKFPLKLFVNTDSQLYFTDNVFLAPSGNPQHESDAVVLANSLSLRTESPSFAVADGLLTPSLGFSYQRYYHSLGRNRTDREQLDFDSYSAPLMLRFRNQSGWEGSLGVTAGSIYRLNGIDGYENIYRNLTPALTVRKLISFDKQNLLTIGATLDYAATWTETPGGALDYRDDRNDKTDYALDVAFYHLLDRWTFNIYGRVAIADYIGYQEAGFNDVNRTDTTFSLGASVTYTITQWASARLFTSSDWRTSTQDDAATFDYTYEAGTIGLGASLNFTF